MPTVECPKHGLRYDPSIHDGCVRCRRTTTWEEARKGPATGPGPGFLEAFLPALVAIACALAAYEYVRLDDSLHPLVLPPYPGMTHDVPQRPVDSADVGATPDWVLSGRAPPDLHVMGGVLANREMGPLELDRWAETVRADVAKRGGLATTAERRFLPLSPSLAAASVRIDQSFADGRRCTELRALVPARRRALELSISSCQWYAAYQANFEDWARTIEGAQVYEPDVLLDGGRGAFLRIVLRLAAGLGLWFGARALLRSRA